MTLMVCYSTIVYFVSILVLLILFIYIIYSSSVWLVLYVVAKKRFNEYINKLNTI